MGAGSRLLFPWWRITNWTCIYVAVVTDEVDLLADCLELVIWLTIIAGKERHSAGFYSFFSRVELGFHLLQNRVSETELLSRPLEDFRRVESFIFNVLFPLNGSDFAGTLVMNHNHFLISFAFCDEVAGAGFSVCILLASQGGLDERAALLNDARPVVRSPPQPRLGAQYE